MNSFKDKNGKLWTIEVNLGTARKVMSGCGVDLLHLIDIDAEKTDLTGLDKIASDPFLLFQVIFILCEQQVRDAGIGEEEFAELFDSDSIQAATDSLVQEVINFSQPAKRKMLTVVYKRMVAFREEQSRHLEEILESEEFEREVSERLSGYALNSQGSQG